MKRYTKQNRGATLLEVLLVLVIVSMLVSLGLTYYAQRAQQAKIDKAVMDAQSILSAAMAYWTDNTKWPASLACLQGSGTTDCTVPYLSTTLGTPWGGLYSVVPPPGTTPNGPFRVYFAVGEGLPTKNYLIASIISNMLPVGVVSNTVGTAASPPPAATSCLGLCYVNTSASIPQVVSGGSMDDTGLLKFAGLYHHGACVPAPICTGSNLTAQVYVAAVQITGSYGSSAGSPVPGQVAPITGFGAYAVGDTSGNPTATPGKCASDTSLTPAACVDAGTAPAGTLYWRVCASVSTPLGTLSNANTPNWAQNQVLLAVVRCSPQTEAQGSSFSTFTP